MIKKPTYKELGKYLEVSEQAVKQYPKLKRDLMLFGLLYLKRKKRYMMNKVIKLLEKRIYKLNKELKNEKNLGNKNFIKGVIEGYKISIVEIKNDFYN